MKKEFEIKLHYTGTQKAVDLIENILIWLADLVPGLDVVGTLEEKGETDGEDQ